jgi:hypothetical protein
MGRSAFAERAGAQSRDSFQEVTLAGSPSRSRERSERLAKAGMERGTRTSTVLLPPALKLPANHR